MHPVVGIVGDMDVGKSTLMNASTGSFGSPCSPLQLTGFISEIIACKERAGNCFRVIYADGEETDLDIEALWDTMEGIEGQHKDIERLILYVEPSMLLDKMRLVDLPGLKMDKDAQVLEFIARETDVLVYVVEPETDVRLRLFEVTDTTLPSETVVVVNKIDTQIKRIDWENPALCLKDVVKSIENHAREQVNDDNTEVIAVSALLALAGEIWDDQIFEGIINIAAPGDFAVMEKANYFSDESRHALLEKANASLKGPWLSPAYNKPAFPALVFAIGLAIHQGLKSPAHLRQALHEFSGIHRLRETILSVSESENARTTARQAALAAEEEILGLHRSQGEIRLLLEATDKMATQVGDGLAHTEERRYFHQIKAHLEAREGELARCLREKLKGGKT